MQILNTVSEGIKHVMTKIQTPQHAHPAAALPNRREYELMMDGGGGGGDEEVHYNLLTDDWGAVSDLDVFFTNMYEYYYARGLSTCVMRGISSIVILGFTVLLSTFLFAFVDWSALLSCNSEETCAGFGEYLTSRALYRPTAFHLLVWVYFLLFFVYWLSKVLSTWGAIKDAVDMHKLYRDRLEISEDELQTMEWSEVVQRFLALQNSGRYRVAIQKRDLTAHDIVSRIMRKENYLIALVNKGILQLDTGLPFMASSPDASVRLLTKSLEWSLHFCLLSHMFNHKFTLRKQFLDDPRSLRMRFVAVGLVQLLLMPFLLLFMVMHFFLQNAQDWHASRNYLGPREWTLLACWTFREFNELPHIFERRMQGSYMHANAYLEQFPKPVLDSAMHLVRFLSGSLIAVMLLMTVLEDGVLLYVKLWDRNLLWYVGVLSAVYAFGRAAAPRRKERVPAEAMEETLLELAAHTHYMPERWRGKSHRISVCREMGRLFQYKANLLLYELVGVLVAPMVLCVSLPRCALSIIDFIVDHTVELDGIGSVCSFSLFDFRRHGNEDYGAPPAAAPAPSSAPGAAGTSQAPTPRPARDTTEQGKMEKSFLNFQQNYPEWHPDAAGQRLIHNLGTFQRQQLEAYAVDFQSAQQGSSVPLPFAPGGGAGVGGGLQASTLHHRGGQRSHHAAPPEQGNYGSAVVGGSVLGGTGALFSPSLLQLEASITPSMIPSMHFPDGGSIMDASGAAGSFYWMERFKLAQRNNAANSIFAGMHGVPEEEKMH
jgi:autophagy-related protein 9